MFTRRGSEARLEPSFLPPLDLLQTLVSSSCLATGPLATRLALALEAFVVAVRAAEAALAVPETAVAAPFPVIRPYRGHRSMKLCAIMTC